MIKISKWFPTNIVQDYISTIGSTLISDLQSPVISYMKFGNICCNIDIIDLLSLRFDALKKKYVDLELYIYLCEIRQYNKKGKEILDLLSKNNTYVKKINGTQYEVFYNSKWHTFTLNSNNTISKNGISTIRQLIIKRIAVYNKPIYQHLISQHTEYFKNSTKWVSLLDYIADTLDSCLLPPGQKLLRHMKGKRKSYSDQPYIIHYDKIKDYQRNDLIASLGIATCPYCNRQYITFWNNNNKDNIHATADLDHYFQKSMYPLFALSLFNFIPSCQLCNSRMKGSSPNRTLYPFEEGFQDNVKFKLKPLKVDEKSLLEMWLGTISSDCAQIELSISDGVDEKYLLRVKNSYETFKLVPIYQAHKMKAIETILKKRIFLEGTYEAYLSDLFNKMNIGSNYLTSSLERLLVGYDWNNENFDEPLSKMIHDIYLDDEYTFFEKE